MPKNVPRYRLEMSRCKNCQISCRFLIRSAITLTGRALSAATIALSEILETAIFSESLANYLFLPSDFNSGTVVAGFAAP
jgi:hypothetical protein